MALSVTEDSMNRFWVATKGGMYLLDRTTKEYSPFPLDTSLARQPQVWSLYLDREGILWAGTQGEGLFRLDTQEKSLQFTRYNPGGAVNKTFRWSVDGIYEDQKGHLWIATFEGLQRINKQTNEVYTFSYDLLTPGSLNHERVNTAYHDQKGDLWIGTDNGVNVAHSNKFRSYQITPTLPSVRLQENQIGPILEDYTGMIWLTNTQMTLDRKLYLYNPKTNQINHFPIDSSEPDNPAGDQVWSMYEDQQNRLWMGTNQALYLFDRNSGKFIQHPTDIWVDNITEDSLGNLWIGGSGIATFNPETEKFKYYEYQPRGHMIDMVFSATGDIWIGYMGEGLDRLNPQTGTTAQFFPKATSPDSRINDKEVRALYEDEEGVLWIGMMLGGLNRFDPKTENFTYYTMQDGLPSNYVVSIVGDDNGFLWLGTNHGISRFDPKTEEFQNYDMSDGLPANHFQWGSAYYRNGSLTFGSDNGFVIFNPDSIQDKQVTLPVYITGFQVMEEERVIPTDPIELPYDQNFLSFDFVALNYQAPEKNQYAYQMEGLDEDWVESGDRRFASYTNLDPGEYTFKVKASHNKGPWNEAASVVQLTILPPWWQTEWAYSLYAMLAIGAIVALRHYELKRFKLRQRATHLAEMDSLKSRFFANISHEFRTPLTLILGPVHRLLNQQTDPDAQPYLQTIERNAQRLLQLVNQLLDLAKLDANKLQLEAIKSEVVAFLRVRATAFSSLAEDKQIDYSIALPEEKVGLYFDRDKLEKVINNLLSNAFKFTPPGGSVALKAHVVTQAGREWVKIQVQNSGKSIPPEVTPLIFDRFYQVENPEQPGSGIGLALTKELVELHYGSIEVESKEGVGTTFTLLLPIGKAHLKESEIIQELPLPEETTRVHSDLHPAEFLSYSADDNSTKQASKVTTEKPVILIVEDHLEVRAFIRDSLGISYQIEEAKNGKEGVEIAKEVLPDLIISDVMMPKMDGYQLCEHIKSQELTSHIPVMLLTAKADRSSKLSGLELGADDYLAKPFDQDELQLLVHNRITERQKMREHFSREITLEPKSVKISSLDEQFLQKAMQTVEDHISDASFGVETFTQEVGMSRAQLFRKLKALTDHTPGDFIRTIRLKRAADLLAQGAGSIADIAYQVGFHDPSYFTKSFQKQFGKTPSEYVAGTVA
jgi:signal transduction histidine kinase/ligand-binding sensor domain-containing protein/DNA-binding response OmpR family regulator